MADTSLSELLRRYVESELGRLHVAFPATVKNYNHQTQRCSVTPSTFSRVGSVEVPNPTIEDVPVGFLRGGGMALTMPLAAGDAVIVLVMDRSIEEWRQTGKQITPRDPRAHHLTDAVAIPMGVWPDATPAPASATDIVLSGPGGVSLTITPSGAVTVTAPSVALGGAGGQAVALAPLVATQLQALGPLLSQIATTINAAAATLDPSTVGTAQLAAVALQASLSTFLSAWPATMASTKVTAQ